MDLFEEAKEAREKAYAPYSNFKVGAALQTADGKLFRGCNVENVSYGLTNCAERTAIFSAIAAGYREFDSMTIVADSDTPIPPCGACRQVIVEFFKPDGTIICANVSGERTQIQVNELLPFPFDSGILKS